MFRRRHNDYPSALDLEELRDSLSDRLRLVFDFATLGAYDEEGDVEVRESATSRPAAEASTLIARPCRTTSSDYRQAAQPHVQANSSECASGSARQTTCAQAIGTTCPAIGKGAARRRRAGHVAVPQQPCTWPEP
jgi:hypothetical protein